MNNDLITDQDIRALQLEAAIHGDDAMVFICERALAGSTVARAACVLAITETQEEVE